jgi:ATP-dependent helicase/nuclease subunit A
VPPAYLTQLALYALCANQMFPGRRVDAAILWTSMESLMKLDPAQLSARVAGFTIG